MSVMNTYINLAYFNYLYGVSSIVTCTFFYKISFTLHRVQAEQYPLEPASYGRLQPARTTHGQSAPWTQF